MEIIRQNQYNPQYDLAQLTLTQAKLKGESSAEFTGTMKGWR